MMKHSALLSVLLCVFCAPPSHACIWDRDTLAMERASFPEVNELIVGYFPRHSKVYYQWRADQITSKERTRWSPADYDDLSVSYDKLGDPDKAIDTMRDKIERYPDRGVYESQANLGTFYIHAGMYTEGLNHIGQAIEINPDAHFGREVYQMLLVRHVIRSRDAGRGLPLSASNHAWGEDTFGRFVLDEAAGGDAAQEQDIDKAITGVLGMMRFGHYDSPILLEALGDLLMFKGMDHGLQRLAARAYLKASYEVDDPAAAQQYRAKAASAIDNQQNDSLVALESQLKQEIAEGDAYFAGIEADEQAWIEAGKDLDAEFQRVYYQTPAFDASPSMLDKARSMSTGDQILVAVIAVPVLLVVLCVSAGVVWVWLRRRRASRSAPEQAAAAQA